MNKFFQSRVGWSTIHSRSEKIHRKSSGEAWKRPGSTDRIWQLSVLPISGKQLSAAIPVCGALGDQQAALVGQNCFHAGEAKNTYGTGCFLLINTGTRPVISNQGLLTTVGYQLNDQPPVFCQEGSIAIAGALVQWLRDNLGLISNADEIENLAKTVEDKTWQPAMELLLRENTTTSGKRPWSAHSTG